MNAGAVVAAILGLTIGVVVDDGVLVAGRDVPVPRKVLSTEPQLPDLARRAGVTNFVVLLVELDTSGKPVGVGVLRGVPLLDQAAIDTVKGWRYEPTMVDGRARRVSLVTVLEFFRGPDDAVRCYSEQAKARSVATNYRVFAVKRLGQLRTHPKVAKVLQRLQSDPDGEVAAAATAALEAR